MSEPIGSVYFERGEVVHINDCDPDGEYLLVRADLDGIDLDAAVSAIQNYGWYSQPAAEGALAVVRAALGIKEGGGV